MLKPFLLVTAVVLLMCTAAIAPARPPQDAAKSPAKESSGAQAKAKSLYKIDCALCHGTEGDGKTDLAKDMELNLVDWTDAKTLAGKSDQELIDIIRKGKGKMPPEDSTRASNDEVKNIVIYIRSLAKAQSATAPAPAAEAPAPAPATPPAPNK